MTKLLKFWVNGTRKVFPDDDDEAIPWIAASKSSDQKEKKEALKNNLKAKSPSPMHFLNNGTVINEGVLFLSQYLTQDDIPLLILLKVS